MEEELEIKVNRELVFEESSHELLDLKSFMFSTSEEREKAEYIYLTDIDKGEIYLEAIEIPISDLREMLDKAEDAGANFVSIDYHCDHMEYDVYGLKIERASTEDVKVDKEKEEANAELVKQEEIERLEKKLGELKK